MSRAPVLKPREVVSVLRTLGFVEVRQRGSPSVSATLTVELQQFLFIWSRYFTDVTSQYCTQYWNIARGVRLASRLE